jgi:predicted enzyme related to lactoylglutathione lyase
MNGHMSLLVYPAKDMASAKTLFKALLGVDPYADAPYYAGFRTGDLEIGLDPNGRSAGPIAYWDVEDIGASLKLLVDAGGETVQDVKDVGGGLLIATVKDAAGNTLGLRQPRR